MTRPTEGTTFTAGGFNDTDNRFNDERTGLIATLVRDARGTDTDISPHNSDGTVRFSPLATDGKLRPDLFAFVRLNGFWVPNPDPNLGFHLVGAYAEGKGPESKPSIDTDEQMIEQSNQPFDFDVTKEDEPFSFTGVETGKPFMQRLRNNLPLSAPNGDLLVETPGGVDAGWAKPLDADSVDRQVLQVRARKRGGKTKLVVVGYSTCKLSDIGNARVGKKGEAAELTFKPIPDGVFMAMIDGEYRPIIRYTWVGGDMWTALGGSPVSEYTVTLGTQSSGTFALTFKGRTTAGIAYNATAAAVKAALVALDDGYEASDWTVTGSAGGPYTVTTPDGTPVSGSGANLSTPGTFVIAPVTS